MEKANISENQDIPENNKTGILTDNARYQKNLNVELLEGENDSSEPVYRICPHLYDK